jgi:hypothetical protein
MTDCHDPTERNQDSHRLSGQRCASEPGSILRPLGAADVQVDPARAHELFRHHATGCSSLRSLRSGTGSDRSRVAAVSSIRIHVRRAAQRRWQHPLGMFRASAQLTSATDVPPGRLECGFTQPTRSPRFGSGLLFTASAFAPLNPRAIDRGLLLFSLLRRR